MLAKAIKIYKKADGISIGLCKIIKKTAFNSK